MGAIIQLVMNAATWLFRLVGDYLFPVSPHVAHIEGMSAAEFVAAVPRCTHGVALFEYHDPLVSTAVQEVKYFGNARITEMLGTVLAPHLAVANALIVPIPISKQRRRERGYNQVEVVVHASQRMDQKIHVCTQLLVRSKHRKSQTTKDRVERIRSLEQCFSVNTTTAATLKKSQLIIVLDDVYTTGTTMQEAVTTLRAAGFTQVQSLAIAHAC